jgi:hypothetical protein
VAEPGCTPPTAILPGPQRASRQPEPPPSLPENADELALLACQAPERCGQASLQLVEAFSYNYRESESRCLLDALARRIPGRYRYETMSSHSSGGATARHLLLVTQAGSVQYVRSEHDQRVVGQPGVTMLDPGQRCSLKPSSYFEACLETEPGNFGNAARPFWDCLFGDGTAATASHLFWFESCVEESPSACEAGGYGALEELGPDAGSGSNAG